MKFIRGDTFEFAGPVTLKINGTDTNDLTGYSATCQVRTEDGVLLGDVEATFLSENPAVLRLFYPDDTQEWTPGWAKLDIEFLTPAGRKVSTRAALFEVLTDVTRRA